MATRWSLVIVLTAGLTSCTSIVQGRDTRDLATITLAKPELVGGAAGASCGFEDDDPCLPGLVCDVDRCVASDPRSGIACTRDDECPSSQPSCNRGLCAALGGQGDACASSSNCMPGFRCSAGGSCRSVTTWCTSSLGCPPADLCADNACVSRW